MNRRSFLKTSALALAASALPVVTTKPVYSSCGSIANVPARTLSSAELQKLFASVDLLTDSKTKQFLEDAMIRYYKSNYAA